MDLILSKKQYSRRIADRFKDNNLHLIVEKTKEIAVDFRTEHHPPISPSFQPAAIGEETAEFLGHKQQTQIEVFFPPGSHLSLPALPPSPPPPLALTVSCMYSVM